MEQCLSKKAPKSNFLGFSRCEENKMDISKYTSYFHDGSIILIERKDNKIVISMESSELDPEEVQNISLTKRHTIKGDLYFSDVKEISINGNYCDKKISRFNDYEIMHLEVSNKSATIEVFSWGGGDVKSQDYATLIIEADHIYWDNFSN
ncbi:MAG: hypothetical protein KGI80_04625 [Verrucomicrobiota bacterium]|nr:hypothetical protein [Verrucomicrobiota bacterium]